MEECRLEPLCIQRPDDYFLKQIEDAKTGKELFERINNYYDGWFNVDMPPIELKNSDETFYNIYMEDYF